MGQGCRAVARRAIRALLTGDMEQVERLYSPDVRPCHRVERELQGLAGIRERALLFASALWDGTVAGSWATTGLERLHQPLLATPFLADVSTG